MVFAKERKEMFSKRFLKYFCGVFSLLVLFTACQGGTSSVKGTATAPVVSTPVANISCSTHTQIPVTLTMSYGSEKQQWISDVVADFNSRHLAACDGPITVNATPVGSGDSMRQIASGQLQPDIWSPAGSV